MDYRETVCLPACLPAVPVFSMLGRFGCSFWLLLTAARRYCNQPCLFVGRELQPATPTACDSASQYARGRYK